MSAVEGDTAVLQFVEEHGFSAERRVPRPVSVFEDQGVLVTESDGRGDTSAATLRRLGDMLGRLHGLPAWLIAQTRVHGAVYRPMAGTEARTSLPWRRRSLPPPNRIALRVCSAEFGSWGSRAQPAGGARGAPSSAGRDRPGSGVAGSRLPAMLGAHLEGGSSVVTDDVERILRWHVDV